MDNTIFECECCGGTFVKIREGEYKCDHCSYVKFIETKTSSEIIALLNQANSLRNKGEFDDACEIYETIAKKDSNNAEGFWGMFLCEYGIMHVEDPKTKKFVPTCNRASTTPILNDANLQKAMEIATGSQQEDLKQKAEQIEKIREKILTLSKNEQPYDVFICYKRTASNENGKEMYTEDAQQAREIYDMLGEEGYKVFFAEKTLQNLAGSEYEPIIFNALNTSKVMIVVCSDPAYINAPWVKNEWRRFIKLMEVDEDKKLIPVMAGGLKAGRLPDLLKKFQGLEINVSFRNNLLLSLRRAIDDKRTNGLERVTLGGIKTAKRSATINSSFKARTLGSKQVGNIDTSDEKIVKIIFNYLENDMLAEALEELGNLEGKRNCEKLVSFVSAYVDNNLNFNKTVADRFNECVPTVSSGIAEYLFTMLEKNFKKTVNPHIYETLMSWDRPNKEELTKTIYDFVLVKADGAKNANAHRVADKENKEEVAISKISGEYTTKSWNVILEHVNAIVKCFESNNVDGYIELLTYLGVISKDNQCSKYCYSKILEVDEGNVAIRYQVYLDGIAGVNKPASESSDKESVEVKNFKAFLQYVDEKNRSKYVLKELERISKDCTYMPKAHIDAIIALLPESENAQLVKYLIKIADTKKSARAWNDAISYYQNILSIDENAHNAYWGILQCKMQCTTDAEMLKSLKRIDEFLEEFNSAVRVAPDDVASKYIAFRKEQATKVQENIEKKKAEKAKEEYERAKAKNEAHLEQERKKTRAKREKKAKTIKILLITLASIVGAALIGFLAWFFQPIVTFVDAEGNVIATIRADSFGGRINLTSIDLDALNLPEDEWADYYYVQYWQSSIFGERHSARYYNDGEMKYSQNAGSIYCRQTFRPVYQGHFKTKTVTVDWTEIRSLAKWSSFKYDVYDAYDANPGLQYSDSLYSPPVDIEVALRQSIFFYSNDLLVVKVIDNLTGEEVVVQHYDEDKETTQYGSFSRTEVVGYYYGIELEKFLHFGDITIKLTYAET